jgi:hypothetical protein
MGLLNEYWTGGQVGIITDSPDLRALMLSASPIFSFHIPGDCGAPLPASVLSDHPLLPGLRTGQSIPLRGCGPAYRVVPTAKVLLEKDRPVEPHEHGIPGLGTIRMPCYILGQHGRGRVAVVHAWPHEWFIRNLNVPSECYSLKLLRWLAGSEPKQI